LSKKNNTEIRQSDQYCMAILYLCAVYCSRTKMEHWRWIDI